MHSGHLRVVGSAGGSLRERVEEIWRERTSEETRARAQQAIGKAREGVEAARRRLEDALKAGKEAQKEAEKEMKARHEEATKGSTD